MLHQKFQGLIAQLNIKDITALSLKIKDDSFFENYLYQTYFSLLMGKLTDAKVQLKEFNKIKKLNNYQTCMKMILYAYYYFKTGELTVSTNLLSEIEKNYQYCLEDDRNENKFWLQVYYIVKGGVAARSGNYEYSLDQFSKSLEFAINVENGTLISQSYNNIGYVNLLLGNSDDAYNCFQDSLKVAETLGTKKLFYYPHSNLGIYYFQMGEIESAERHHLLALVYALKNDNPLQIASEYRDLGELAQYSGDFEKSFELSQKALQLHIQIGNEISIASSLINLVEVSLGLNYIELAKNYHFQLKDLNSFNDNPLLINLSVFAEALILKYQPSLVNQVKAMEIFDKLKDELTLDNMTRIRCMLYLCDILLFEYKISNNPEPLIEINSLTLSLTNFAEKSNSHLLYVNILGLRAHLAMIQNDYESTIKLYNQAIDMTQIYKMRLLESQFKGRLFELEKLFITWNNKFNNDTEFRSKFIEEYLSGYVLDVLKVKEEFRQKKESAALQN